MENVLYDAKGLKKSNIIIQCMLDVFLIAIGVAAIFFSQLKHAVNTISFYTSSGQPLDSGNLGGGYFFDEGARKVIITVGIILIIIAVIFFESIIASNKSYITVFDNHVEAMQCAAFFVLIKKPVNVTYNKIRDLQLIKSENALNTDKIVIYTDIGKFVIVVHGCDRAYEIIKNKIELF